MFEGLSECRRVLLNKTNTLSAFIWHHSETGSHKEALVYKVIRDAEARH